MSGLLDSIAGYSASADGSFQKYTIIVALVILIGTLAMMGAALYNSSGSETFPPTSGPCPDYWTVEGGKCVHPDGSDSGTITYNPDASVCEKKKSLKGLNDPLVSWDGVSNSKVVCAADYNN